MGEVQYFPRLYAEGFPISVSLLQFFRSRLIILVFRSHSTLELTKVNTYGLVYVWKGTDSSLKPLLLAAHQGKPCNPLCLMSL